MPNLSTPGNPGGKPMRVEADGMTVRCCDACNVRNRFGHLELIDNQLVYLCDNFRACNRRWKNM